MERQYLHDIIEQPLPSYGNHHITANRFQQKRILSTPVNTEAKALICRSDGMLQVLQLMSKVAVSDSTVLITGETGTGKELVAGGIHRESPRNSKQMVKVNCAALPPTLIESELFGHERGSFTGATDRRIGKFELAHHSTLFLDEIGEMPMDMQVKLLRVIQERELERVGGHNTIKVNVRIIVATNRNLEQEVKSGRFREDLYYRLNVFPIEIPALRDRPDDVELLAKVFLAKYAAKAGKTITDIAPEVMVQLTNYRWPGNVRELEHLIERSVLLEQETILREVRLPKERLQPEKASQCSQQTLQDMERNYIIEILKKFKGKISGTSGASAFLAIPPSTLHSKIRKLGISKIDYYA